MSNRNIEVLLQQYYPKGLSKEEAEYWTTAEYKNYESLVVNTVHTPSRIYKEWAEFVEGLSDEIKTPVTDFTDGQTPSFFASIPVTPSKNQLSLPGLIEEICIYKSFLVDYFSIIGSRSIKWTNSMGFPTFTNLEILVSPSDYTSEVFNTVFESVRRFSKGFQLMTFKESQTVLEGFDLPYSDKTPCTLFDAVFAPFDFSGFEINGNIEYEMH